MPVRSTLAAPTDDPPNDDARLVFAAQKNPAAFQALYDRWAVPVYQYFYYRAGDAAAAEDLTSQLFLAVYQALPRYQHRGHFAAWLFAIARNLIRKDYRHTRRQVSLEQAGQVAAGVDLPDEYAQADEIQRLKALIVSLPPADQELIRLRYAAGLSFSDMAILLHKREDAVKKSLYRLQARLQVLLEQKHG